MTGLDDPAILSWMGLKFPQYVEGQPAPPKYTSPEEVNQVGMLSADGPLPYNPEVPVTGYPKIEKPAVDNSAYISWLMGNDQAAKERKDRTLTGLKDIAEGFGNMHAVTPGEIMFGRKPQPYIAEDLRDDRDKLEDQMTDSDREQMSAAIGNSLGSSSFKIPKGMTWSRLEKFFPHMTGSNNPLAWRRMELMAKAEEGKNERFDKSAGLRARGLGIAEGNLAVRGEVADRPTPTATTKIEDLDFLAQSTQDLKKEFQESPALQQQIGPIAGRWNKLLTGLGIADPEFTTFSANVETIIANNLYALSGKQINEAERADLRRTVFDTMQSGENFEALLDNYLKRIQTKRESILKVQEATGRNVEKLREISPAGTKKLNYTGSKTIDQETKGWRWWIGPDGSRRQVHPDDEARLDKSKFRLDASQD